MLKQRAAGSDQLPVPGELDSYTLKTSLPKDGSGFQKLQINVSVLIPLSKAAKLRRRCKKITLSLLNKILELRLLRLLGFLKFEMLQKPEAS